MLKPSEVLQPKSLKIASPITDHFYVRGTYFPASVTTDAAARSERHHPGTTLSGEDDLGLDDKVDQGRMEFDIRLRDATTCASTTSSSTVSANSRWRTTIVFGDFIFPAGHQLPQPSSTGACSR